MPGEEEEAIATCASLHFIQRSALVDFSCPFLNVVGVVVGW